YLLSNCSMNFNRPENSEKLLTLQEAAQQLAATPDVLLLWNEYNILKPTITQSGQIGYTQKQIDQFLTIQKLTQNGIIQPEKIRVPIEKMQTLEPTQKNLPNTS